MFERFAERSRQAVVMAQEEAWDMRQPQLGSEHLILGLAHEGGAACAVLEASGVTLEGARRVVAQGPAGGPGPGHSLPWTSGAKLALERAFRYALAMGHSSIKTEHLLLGLLDEEDGGARRLLDVMGANGDRLRVATLAALAKS